MSEDAYTKKGVEELFSNDGLSAGEYGFMRGYLDAA